MAIEIGTLVLKGRFGPARTEAPARHTDFEEALEILRREMLREMDEKLEAAERRSRER